MLVIIQVASLRSPITSTRHYETETRKKRWDSMPDGRAFALTRLRIGPFIRSAAISRIPIPSFLFLVVVQFALRSWRIAACPTWPTLSPSFQHSKSSYSNNFLSSIPILHTTSSSIISEIKYCGIPLE